MFLYILTRSYTLYVCLAKTNIGTNSDYLGLRKQHKEYLVPEKGIHSLCVACLISDGERSLGSQVILSRVQIIRFLRMLAFLRILYTTSYSLRLIHSRHTRLSFVHRWTRSIAVLSLHCRLRGRRRRRGLLSGAAGRVRPPAPTPEPEAAGARAHEESFPQSQCGRERSHL